MAQSRDVHFISRTYVRIKKLLSRVMNKQFLIFLFFVALSTVFWLFKSLGATYEMEFEVPLKLVNVPEKAVITTELPKTMRVVVKDRGAVLLQYRYVSLLSPVTVDFTQDESDDGHVVTLTREYIKQVTRQFPPSAHIVSYKPDTLEYYYNYGSFKRVPVRLQGSFKARERFGISGLTIAPDSVNVYALQEVLDTITGAYTVTQKVEELSENKVLKADLRRIKGAKFTPPSITAKVYVDQITEKTVAVPIQFVNFPATKVLRTFPSKVNITFQVGTSKYNSITADNFVLVASYDELVNNTTGKYVPHLKTVPLGASHIRISPQEVEFLIEDVPAEN